MKPKGSFPLLFERTEFGNANHQFDGIQMVVISRCLVQLKDPAENVLGVKSDKAPQILPVQCIQW